MVKPLGLVRTRCIPEPMLYRIKQCRHELETHTGNAATSSVVHTGRCTERVGQSRAVKRLGACGAEPRAVVHSRYRARGSNRVTKNRNRAASSELSSRVGCNAACRTALDLLVARFGRHSSAVNSGRNPTVCEDNDTRSFSRCYELGMANVTRRTRSEKQSSLEKQRVSSFKRWEENPSKLDKNEPATDQTMRQARTAFKCCRHRTSSSRCKRGSMGAY